METVGRSPFKFLPVASQFLGIFIVLLPVIIAFFLGNLKNFHILFERVSELALFLELLDVLLKLQTDSGDLSAFLLLR